MMDLAMNHSGDAGGDGVPPLSISALSLALNFVIVRQSKTLIWFPLNNPTDK
jgi:hypothetical protein